MEPDERAAAQAAAIAAEGAYRYAGLCDRLSEAHRADLVTMAGVMRAAALQQEVSADETAIMADLEVDGVAFWFEANCHAYFKRRELAVRDLTFSYGPDAPLCIEVRFENEPAPERLAEATQGIESDTVFHGIGKDSGGAVVWMLEAPDPSE